MNASEVSRLLIGAYGDRPWHPHHDPLSELIAVILSQNTSDTNSQRAFDSLLTHFGDWEAVSRADTVQIEQAIHGGGLSHIKAARIRDILQRIRDERDSLDLDFLDQMPLAEAKSWLRSLPGVGPKTVGCVLLFSLGKPVMPVDTHVYRVARRVGLIANKVSVEQAHDLLEEMIPAEDIYPFHMNMVVHGRRVCRAQRPLCPECVLRGGCAWIERNSRN